MAIFKLTQASNCQREETVEIKTLEELLEFVRKVGGDIILRQERDYVNGGYLESFEIVIYDDYVE
jgi:hypothetical protein